LLHRKAERRAVKWWVPASLALVAGGALLAQPALAATPAPESATQCGGILKRAKPTADDPNLLSYKFTCDWGISAYTLIVTRKANDDATIDDYGSSVSVFDPTGNPLSTESFSCSGTIPGNGVNCNAGAGGFMAAPNWAEGTFDTTDPYCPNIPKGSPAGTKPEPGAVVELVVSDTTGAEDGPFRLRLAGKCPAVHVKPKVKSKTSGKQARAARLA
jgi:hypothetical protein